MKTKIILFVLAATILLVECHPSIDDLFIKCHLSDDACMKKSAEKLIPFLQTTHTELDITPMDPFKLDALTVSFLDVFAFTVSNAEVTGIKNCEYVDLTGFIERKYANMHTKCNINLEGDFKVTSTSPFLTKLLGVPEINYTGTGKITFTNVNMFFRFFYHLQKEADGEIYLKSEHKNITQTYSYDGEVVFEPITIFSENQKSKNFFVNFIEEHSSILKATFGSVYNDRVMDFFYEYQEEFFNNVPAKKYIYDDLAPLLHAKEHHH